MLDLKKYGLTKSDYGKIKATGGFNTEEYYEGCVKLREVFDNPAITTDVIVGFRARQRKISLRHASSLRKYIFTKCIYSNIQEERELLLTR